MADAPDITGAAPSRRRKRDNNRGRELTLAEITRVRGRELLPHHLLFECASGYALFDVPQLTQIGMSTIESVEEYLNSSDQQFKLKASYIFSSDDEALAQMEAISKSSLTDLLEKFLLDCLPQPSTGGSRYFIATCDAALGSRIVKKTGLASRSAVLINDVTRGLRENIDKFLGLERGVLEKAQINLAHLYYNTKSPVVVSSSFSHSLKEQFRVVPHRFEGVFNAKGKENMVCTKNLVPGEALYGEELICGQNEEDRTEVEYRVWDPCESKLGAAILFGVANIWIKPGSRVLYIGNVCGLTVSNLSDLVGSDGFVYVVGFSADVVDMAGKRPNVVTIFEKYFFYHGNYRMLVGMVDVIFAEIDRLPEQLDYMEANFIVNNAHFYLRSGGHYMISTRAKDFSSTGHVKDFFADRNCRNEFKPIETVMLNLRDGAYALAVGGYRMLEE